jgi:hypothetical protein
LTAATTGLAKSATWIIGLELAYIAELDIDFDLTVTGFETAAIDILLEAEPAQGYSR